MNPSTIPTFPQPGLHNHIVLCHETKNDTGEWSLAFAQTQSEYYISDGFEQQLLDQLAGSATGIPPDASIAALERLADHPPAFYSKPLETTLDPVFAESLLEALFPGFDQSCQLHKIANPIHVCLEDPENNRLILQVTLFVVE